MPPKEKKIMNKHLIVLGVAAVLAAGACAQADISVSKIGDDGWYSIDTRQPGVGSLIGYNDSWPNHTGTIAQDTLIENQIKFVGDYLGRSAVELTFGAGSPSGKASIGKIDTGAGFATGEWDAGFYMNLGRYKVTSTNSTVKLGIQSSNWATSHATGDNIAWDITLKYTGDHAEAPGNWADLALTPNGSLTSTIADTATWKINIENDDAARTLNNAYTAAYKNGSALYIGGNYTLAELAGNTFWHDLLFGSSSKVTGIVLEAGSFSVASDAYYDYIQSNILHDGQKVDFCAPVPEPSSIMALLAGLGSIAALRLRKK
jgi:hypothetical protein